jgi:hypothetical protein
VRRPEYVIARRPGFCHCEERSDVAISTPHVLPCKPMLMIDPLRGGHRTETSETGKRWVIEIASHTLAVTEERRSR